MSDLIDDFVEETGVSRMQLREISRSMDARFDELSDKLELTNKELLSLKQDLELVLDQIDENSRRLVVNKVNTEIIRVQQQLDKEFGDYGKVRNTMIGILQATDSALVRIDTISSLSEELMLQVPEYWLAPCVIALAAWIANDRDLARRAIAEAQKRNEEKTALVMALICRRNNRTDTCYEWLSIYFSHQKTASFSEDTFVYLDAYINGVFGKDEKHICDDYVRRWRQEIEVQRNGGDQRERDFWRNYFVNRFENHTCRLSTLEKNSSDAAAVEHYVDRIVSVEHIKKRFSDVANVPVDLDELRASIDARLIELVNRYDKKEEELLQEKHKYEVIKEYKGDEQRAERVLTNEKVEKEERVISIIDQMRKAAISEQGNPSAKKTAITFLAGDIDSGLKQYLDESKQTFPQAVHIQCDDFATVYDGNNSKYVLSEFDEFCENNKNEEIQILKNEHESAATKMKVGAIVSVVLLFVLWQLAILTGMYTAYVYFEDQKYDHNLTEIEHKYRLMHESTQRELEETMREYNKALDIVNNFDSNVDILAEF